MKKQTLLILTVCILGFSFLIFTVLKTTNNIAYVNNSKLLIGFSESNKINKEYEIAKKKYQDNLETIEDSVKQHMDLMSKEYDKSTTRKKTELQTKLRQLNQDLNRYRETGKRSINEEHQKKMAEVVKKINTYVADYGKEHKYDFILGTTAGGNIMYSNDSKFDITADIVKGLNERYK